jgi:hypothetical protein
MITSQRQISEADDSRRKLVVIVAVVALVLISGLFYILMKASSGRTTAPVKLESAIRPGSPEWDQYIKYIVMDAPIADEAKRGLGDTVMWLKTSIKNFTGKTINGLEIRGAVVDQKGRPVKEKTLVLIPSAAQMELEPNKTVAVQVVLDGMKDSDDRANIKMEITGFRIKP